MPGAGPAPARQRQVGQPRMLDRRVSAQRHLTRRATIRTPATVDISPLTARRHPLPTARPRRRPAPRPPPRALFSPRPGRAFPVCRPSTGANLGDGPGHRVTASLSPPRLAARITSPVAGGENPGPSTQHRRSQGEEGQRAHRSSLIIVAQYPGDRSASHRGEQHRPWSSAAPRAGQHHRPRRHVRTQQGKNAGRTSATGPKKLTSADQFHIVSSPASTAVPEPPEVRGVVARACGRAPSLPRCSLSVMTQPAYRVIWILFHAFVPARSEPEPRSGVCRRFRKVEASSMHDFLGSQSSARKQDHAINTDRARRTMGAQHLRTRPPTPSSEFLPSRRLPRDLDLGRRPDLGAQALAVRLQRGSRFPVTLWRPCFSGWLRHRDARRPVRTRHGRPLFAPMLPGQRPALIRAYTDAGPGHVLTTVSGAPRRSGLPPTASPGLAVDMVTDLIAVGGSRCRSATSSPTCSTPRGPPATRPV